MLQTRLLLLVGAVLLCIILAGLSFRLLPISDEPAVARLKLCACYYNYLEATHDEIDALEQRCWRSTGDPTLTVQ